MQPQTPALPRPLPPGPPDSRADADIGDTKKMISTVPALYVTENLRAGQIIYAATSSRAATGTSPGWTLRLALIFGHADPGLGFPGGAHAPTSLRWSPPVSDWLLILPRWVSKWTRRPAMHLSWPTA